jgi:hypothetical protein
MIFLEAVTIEQSKYLDFNSISCLLGQTIRRTLPQRELLNKVADEEVCKHLFRLNGQLCGIDQCTDFYYDPPTKHYTGIKQTLKGWCPSIGHADKVLQGDFIHTSQGQPVYMVHADNYYDLRVRYKIVIAEFRSCFNISASTRITIILDRGIYSSDVFSEIKNDPSVELITQNLLNKQ